MIDERSSWTFSMNGEASSTFMKRVSAWMSTVLPTRRNCTRGTLVLSTAGGPALPFLPAGGGADDCCAVLIVLVCTIEVTHVYGGRARLTSSMMCGQTKRLSSNDSDQVDLAHDGVALRPRALRCSRMTPE